jgi:NAD(P)-dependent dehydrogenase (short-subunit alcohol dehydrogenase family)
MTDHSIKGKAVNHRRRRQEPRWPARPRSRSPRREGDCRSTTTARPTKADAEATVAAVKAAGAAAAAIQADLTDGRRRREALRRCESPRVGRPDIAINTVGKVLKKPMAEISARPSTTR